MKRMDLVAKLATFSEYWSPCAIGLLVRNFLRNHQSLFPRFVVRSPIACPAVDHKQATPALTFTGTEKRSFTVKTIAEPLPKSKLTHYPGSQMGRRSPC